MPKLSFKILNFSGGTMTMSQREDQGTTGEISIFAENVEALSERGVLQGVSGHYYSDLGTTISGTKMDTIDTPDDISTESKDVLWFDPTDGFIKVIQDFYAAVYPKTVIDIGQLALGGYGIQTWAKRGSRLYLGLGGEVPTKFVQYMKKTQFGIDFNGYKVCNGELSPASMMSNVDTVDMPNEHGSTAWTSGEDWKYAISSTASERIFRYREADTGGIESEISNIIGSGLKSISCSQVEDKKLWILANDSEGYSKLIKIGVNNTDFVQCTVDYTKQIIKGFTTPTGGKDARTETNLDYRDSYLSVTDDAQIKKWIMKDSSEIIAVKQDADVEDIYILNHWGGADGYDWLSYAETHLGECRFFLGALDKLQANSSHANSPFFSAHHFVWGKDERGTVDSTCDLPHEELGGGNTLFYAIDHPARILWAASNTDCNASTSPSTQIENHIPSNQKVVRFHDKSPYWHYPKTSFQYEENDPYVGVGAGGGSNHSWMHNTAPLSSNFNGYSQHGMQQADWHDEYTDSPGRHTTGQFVFYDTMWLYKWTKLCPAGKNFNNKGGPVHDYENDSAGALLWPDDPSTDKANQGFSSYTTRPWGCIDNGASTDYGGSSAHDFWIDHSVYTLGNYQDGHTESSNTFMWNSELFYSNSTFGSEEYWHNARYMPNAGPNEDMDAWSVWDRQGHILGRAKPFHSIDDGFGLFGGKGPFDMTNTRFGTRQFTGVYDASLNSYGSAGNQLGQSYQVVLGSGCGWTGLVNFSNWHLE